MIDSMNYVPVLKWKKGEQDALSCLPKESIDSFTPLLEIPFIEWDYKDEVLKRSLEKHTENIIKSIKDLNNASAFIDFRIVEDFEHITQNLAQKIFNSCPSNIQLIPVISPSSKQVSINTARNNQKNGICYRIREDYFEDIESAIDLLNSIVKNPDRSKVDLIIDLASIYDYSLSSIKLLTKTVLSSIPHINEWRSLILLASSFPRDLSCVPRDTIKKISRYEWENWHSLYKSKKHRMPTYGDYPIAHPEMVDLDFRFMDRSASIRYSDENDWIIVKGQSVKRRAQAIQYREKSQILISQPEYYGQEYSWGDKYIYKCANGGKTGSATVWRQVGVNHHIHVVLNQLASLS